MQFMSCHIMVSSCINSLLCLLLLLPPPPLSSPRPFQQQLDSGSWAEGAVASQGKGEGEASASANSSLPAFPDQATDTGFGGAEGGFSVDWSANFSAPASTEGAAAADAGASAAAAAAAPAPAADGGWPPASGWGAAEATQPPAGAEEEAAAGGDEVSGQGLIEQTPGTESNPERDLQPELQGQEQEQGQGPEGAGGGWAEQAGWGEGQQGAIGEGEAEGEAAVPGIVFTNEYGQEVQGGAENTARADVDASGSEYDTADELDDAPGHNGGWMSADDELAASEEQGAAPDGGVSQGGFADWGAADAPPFPEQAPAADTGFGGEGFAAQWDQPAAAEPKLEEAVPAQQNTQESAVPQPALDIPEPAQGSDPFGTDGDPFGADSDPFGTEKDPFATSEDPFGTSGSDPFGTSDKDPFADAQQDLFADQGGVAEQDLFANQGGVAEQDLFANQGGSAEQDLFANQGTDMFPSQAPAEGAPVGFTSDPFAESSEQGGAAAADGSWAADPFATDAANQSGWAGGWESTGGGGGDGGSGGEGKDSSQWAAFPNPAPASADADSSSKGSWQEVSDSSGFFSSDGQGDFAAGWGADTASAGSVGGGAVGGSQPQDFFAAFPSPSDPAAGSSVPMPKEPENSDLSEDEVANRRYGKLYQEIDTERDEVPDFLTPCVA